MGGAIMQGLAAAGGYPALVATNRTAEKARTLADLPGVSSIALQDEPEANSQVAAAADVLLVGVKPVMVPDLLREVSGSLRRETVVVSLAAGVTIDTFENILPAGQPVLRSMPNTPSLVGKGVTGIAAGTHATEQNVAVVRALFETVGVVVQVPESQIDPLSTISGSGPAYFYFFVEQLTAAAEHQGFSREQARALAEGTFVGAAALLQRSDVDPAELRRRVTSPKGTTEQAVAVLSAAGFEDILQRATDAALARAQQMAAGN